MRASPPGALSEIDESYINEAAGDEKDFIESMIANYGLDHQDESAGEAAPPAEAEVRVAAASALEAIPLPWFVSGH